MGWVLGENIAELVQEGAFEPLTHDNFHSGNVVVMVWFDEYEDHNDPGSLKRVGDQTEIQK